MRIPWKRAKTRLATVWLGGGGVIFLILLPMVMMGKFHGVPKGVEDAFGWYLTTIMPNLSLIIGALVEDVRAEPEKKIKHVDSFFYRLAVGFSIFYLGVVLLTLFGSTFSILPPEERGVAMLRLSNLWLAPIQGLVTGILGFFYLRARPSAATD